MRNSKLKPADAAWLTSTFARNRAMFGGFQMIEETDEERTAREEAERKAAEDADRTFTQAEVTRMLTAEKRQGRTAERSALLDKLGFKDETEAEAFITAQREAQQAAMTEQQRKEAELAQRETAAEREKREAAEERRTARLERALVRRGVGDDDLDDAVLLLSRGLEDDADADAIAEAADALKERRAELFGGTAEAGETRHVRNGGNIPAGRKGNRPTPPAAPFGAKGLERAKRRGFIKD